MNIEFWKNFLVNYSYVDHPDHATVDITSGGSSGGDCWGGYTCRFDISEHEMEKELIRGIEYFTKQLNLSFNNEEIKEFINKNNILDKYEDKSEGGDYYGNYTDTHIHAIYFLELLDFIEEKSLLEEDKKQYLQVYHEIVDENQKKLEEKIHLQNIANIETTLFNLDKNKHINITNLKREKVRLENSLKVIDEKILKFDEDLQKEKNRLNQKLKKLKESSKNNSSSKMKIK